MPGAAKTEPVQLDNRLAWQGWQVDLPASWNPVWLTGGAGAGTVTVADLERPRLVLDWRRVRSPDRVDLCRLAGVHRRTPLTWTALSHPLIGEAIADGRQAAADNGDLLALLLSKRSPRLLFVRIVAGDQPIEEALAQGLLSSIGDHSGALAVPWCVYDFAWSVPEGFELSDRTFAAGRARLTFRRRRQSLTFERTTLAGRCRADVGPNAEAALECVPKPSNHTGETPVPHGFLDAQSATVLEHKRHAVSLRPASPRTAWERLVARQSWTAQWVCPASQRSYRVEAAGPDALDLLKAAIQSVNCHRTADGSHST